MHETQNASDKGIAGLAAMARNGDHTLWLSVGVFDSSTPLERAISELHHEGFSNRDMCLIGTSPAFSEMVRRPLAPPVPRCGRPLYQRQRHQLPWLSGKMEVVATSGLLLRTLVSEAAAEQADLGSAPAYLIQDLCNTLDAHIGDGAIVLLVSATDHNQQNQGSRVLLRHSFHTVQTYAVPAHVSLSSAGA